MPYGSLRKMVSSCNSRSYRNSGRSVSLSNGTAVKVDVFRCCELFRLPCRNCGRGDRGGVAIYRPFGNFTELNRAVTCMVLKVNDRRTFSPMPR
ncbi:hypothetical protein TNCV_309311 [Trichonephila clavipes]|nr:hypothetical protein TNCV_309311 [Trichonephila clavipes]